MQEKEERIHLVFWWLFPCKAISGVFRELAELPTYRVTVVCVHDVIEVRKRLGHGLPDYGKAELIILPTRNWKPEADRLLGSSRSAIHFFDGMQAYDRIRYSLRKALKMWARVAVMTEAFNNSFSGLKWLAKEIYWRTILPLATRPFVRRNMFVLCLSGSSQTDRRSLRRLGWRDEQIFPFGYFSEQPPVEADAPNGPEDPAAELRLLCTGYLTKNKGHRVLLRALSLLKTRGLRFHCDITGYGPEEARLRALSRSLRIDSAVAFRGVVPTEELNGLMRSADIFVAPGVLEPWGIRINEAIQAGLPVVVSDGIGACELVRASGGGVVFRSGDSEELADALFSLISEPEKLYKCKERCRNYRQHIHPRAAVNYFDKVMRYTLNPTGEKPLPPWLYFHSTTR